MTTYVLLSSGEGEAVRFFSIDIDGTAYDSSGHQTQVRLAAGENPVERTTRSDGATKRLPFPDDDVCPVMARCFNHAERDWLGSNNQCCMLSNDFFCLCQPFIEDAKWIWLFEVDSA